MYLLCATLYISDADVHGSTTDHQPKDWMNKTWFNMFDEVSQRFEANFKVFNCPMLPDVNALICFSSLGEITSDGGGGLL